MTGKPLQWKRRPRGQTLTKRGHGDAIPGLEILANDVRCTHTAAIAQIDPDQLFYLRARGLREDVASRLVIEGFLAELVERFEEGPVREALAGALERRVAGFLGWLLLGPRGCGVCPAIRAGARLQPAKNPQ